MKNILIVTLGLIIGGLVGGGIIYLAQQKDNGVVYKPDEKLPAVKETSIVLTVREQELQKRLSESENARNQLQAQAVALQRQLAEIKENGALQADAKEGELKDKSSQAKENMRRYARAILAMDGKDETLMNDQALQTAYQELMADIMKLMAKYNINFNTWGSGVDELYKTYAIPEIRQWFGGLGAAIFEELGAPLTEAQLKSVDETMLRTAEEGKKLDDPSFSRLEKAVMFQRFKTKQGDEFRDIFTDEQEKKFPEEVATAMIGVNRDSILPRSDASGKTRDECSNIIIQKWGNELKLNDTEKQGVKYMSDMYVNEYGVLKASAEAEYGKEFMDYNLERYDRADKDKYREWRKSRWQYFNNPENKRKQEAVNLRFAELQLKYQKQLQGTFPDKQALIKEQGPQITHFPYLGE